MLSKLLLQYGAFITRRPILGQVATAGVITTLGDVLAQTVVEKKSKFEWKRTFVMGGCGAGYFGPILAVWLTLLNKFTAPLILKVAADQLIFTPPLLTGFFFTQSALMGRGFEEARLKIKHELFTILKMNWSLWVPVQFINFYFIPFQYRMLVIQSVALFWNTYISFKANNNVRKVD